MTATMPARGSPAMRLSIAIIVAFGLSVGLVAMPADAQEACLAIERLKSVEKTGDTCRFHGAILNRCGHDVKYAIVRAVPHPERGPLPTVTGTVPRFQLAPLSFDRDICQQGHHVLEVTGDGRLRDATGQPIAPPLASEAIAPAAERINACVRTCPVPELDRQSLIAELRKAYGGAVDVADAAPAIEDYISITLARRQARDQLCAAICQGASTQEEASLTSARIDTESEQTLAAPIALLAAIAARPAAPKIAAPSDALPEAVEGPAPPRKWRGRKRHVATSANRCRTIGASGRCRLVLNIEPRGRSTKTR